MSLTWLCLDLKQFSQCLVVSGYCLLLFPVGIPWYYGNLTAYTDSYFVYRVGPQAFDVQANWPLASFYIFLVIGYLTTDWLAAKCKTYFLFLITFLFFDLCISITYFTVQCSVGLMMITLMICGGYIDGFMSILCLKYVSIKVAPERVGLASAVISAANGFGALLFNYITTAHINPENLSPDARRSNMVYFSQESVLKNVPSVFIVIGATSFGIQTLGYILQQLPHCIETISGKSSVTMELSEGNAEFTSHSTDYGTEQHLTKVNNVNETIRGSFNVAPLHTNGINDDRSLPEQQQEEEEEEEEQEVQSMKPLKVLCTRTFYVLCLCVSTLTYGTFLTQMYYKFFGQLWIKDDTFLTSVGGFAAVWSAIVRLAIGAAIDKTGLKNTFISVMLLSTVFLPLWYITPRFNRWLYAFVFLSLSGIQGSVYIIIPMAALKLYGPKYYATNFGLIMVSNVVTNFASPLLFDSLLSNYGWFSIALVGGLTSLVALVCVVMVMPADDGKLGL